MVVREFEDRLASTWPPSDWRGVTVLAAVSGGGDSVALLRGLSALAARTPGPGRIVVAHFHHGLRGAAADDDAAFVADLARQLGLECEIGRAAPGELAPRQRGREGAARHARYEFFRAVAGQCGARFVVTAHTADDQVETLLQRLLRGTGVAGLAGIPRARSLVPGIALLRPLLTFRRDELRDYLDQLGQPFRHDASNDDEQFARNRLRHELLPLLARRYSPDPAAALLRLAESASNCTRVVARLVDELAAHAVEHCGDRVRVDCAKLASADSYLVRELFVAVWKERHWPRQAMTTEHWHALATLVLDPVPARRTFPGAIDARRESEFVELWRGSGTSASPP